MAANNQKKGKRDNQTNTSFFKNQLNRFKDFFKRIASKPLFTRRQAVMSSMDWYKNRIRIATGKTIDTKNYGTVADLRQGGVFQYVYDPKHKQTLPYYDKFPLIIPIEMKPDGWLALNLHYLPPAIRAIVFDDILKYATKGRTKMMVAYDWVRLYSRYPVIQHCIKRYLVSHVVSPIVLVPEEEWVNCVLLPSQTFAKKTDEQVWAIGRQLYSKKKTN